ncbi:MAG TPA: hypothetical protein VF607_10465, partial [Verrucomicrobiae bacterium]
IEKATPVGVAFYFSGIFQCPRIYIQYSVILHGFNGKKWQSWNWVYEKLFVEHNGRVNVAWGRTAHGAIFAIGRLDCGNRFCPCK